MSGFGCSVATFGSDAPCRPRECDADETDHGAPEAICYEGDDESDCSNRDTADDRNEDCVRLALFAVPTAHGLPVR